MPLKKTLVGKTQKEKVSLKVQAIVSAAKKGKYKRGNVDLDILSVSPIEGGVEVFARVFKDGKQLGFGADGSVDIERFLIFNPPVMVPDGTKKVEILTGEFEGVRHETDNFKENPDEAIKMCIVDSALLVGKENSLIEPGKTGRTTATFYPSAGNVSPIDGRLDYGAGGSWASVRALTSSSGASTTDVTTVWVQSESLGGVGIISRCPVCFDTSTIGAGAVISAATLSLYSTTTGDLSESTNRANLAIVSVVLASTASLSVSDFNIANWGSTRFATDVPLATFIGTSQYHDFALNASGISNINLTGVSQFGVRASNDIDNAAPTLRSYGVGYFADETGTTKDPKLVVTYSVPVYIPRSNTPPKGAVRRASFI